MTITLSQAAEELGILKNPHQSNYALIGIDYEKELKSLSKYKKKKARDRLLNFTKTRRFDLVPTKIEQARRLIPELRETPNRSVLNSYALKKYVADRHPEYAKVLEEENRIKSENSVNKSRTAASENYKPMKSNLKKAMEVFCFGKSPEQYQVSADLMDAAEWILQNKKASPEVREILVCDFLRIKHCGEAVNGYDGVTESGRHIEVKTEQAKPGENHKVNGAHQFSTISCETMKKKIEDNPIMAHAGFVDGQVAFVVTFMLGEINTERLLSDQSSGTKNRCYTLSDWASSDFRLHYLNKELLHSSAVTKTLRELLLSRNIYPGK